MDVPVADLTLLVETAERSASHWHLNHGRWDKDGSPCGKCALIDRFRPIEACRSCAEHYR